MLSITFLHNFVAEHNHIAYLLIILGVIIEGEIVVIIAGIFAHLASLNFFIAFGATIVGCIIKSILGYSLGYYLQKEHSERSIVTRAENRINYFLPRFSERPFWSIFLSRFLILGMNWFALIYAGYKKIKIRTYIEAEISSMITWSLIMLLLGYTFSYTALSISHDVRKFLGIILIGFISFFILEKIIAIVIELFATKKGDL